ncbi:MAG: hypothetical protein KBT15_07010 [Bacteroidales bacterium]|nr:hypothetical protein [Candidatus Minthousia equi]
MKRLFAFTLLFQLMLLTAQAQGPSKTCPTCGLSMAKCQYKGKHPKPAANKPTANKPSATTGNINGYEWVDLGLSVKWATCNVGADKPEDYGGYYAWGETTTKSRYDWDNCFDCLDDCGESWSVYKIGGKTKIEPNSGHDTARQNWGGSWRMPTIKELEELNSKCIWKWTSKGGHNGYVVTGPNGKSIFLPAAGFRYSTLSGYMSEDGYYWSGTLDSDNSARTLTLCSDYHITINGSIRSSGHSIRPVTD